MPTAKGWVDGHAPTAAPGLKVNAFAKGLKHPRWIHVLPNGDVLTAEALGVDGGRIRTPFDYAMYSTEKRAAAIGDSPNRITLLRDADGDGVAEVRYTYGRPQPSGMAMLDGTFYVGNTDGLMAFPYTEGATRGIKAAGRKIADYKPAGHWTRSILPSRDGKKLYVGVGSLSNIAEHGFEVEEGRACIYEVDLETGQQRIFAGGLRNPVGFAFEPTTGDLFTVVNERDGLGDETPPDYLTRSKDGGSCMWLALLSYWGKTVGRTACRRIRPRSRPPSVPIMRSAGPHCLARPVLALPAGTLPGFPDQHGDRPARSWNPFEPGRLQGDLRALRERPPVGAAARHPRLDFPAPDEKYSYGRPVGVTIGPDGSLLVADDVGDVIWRVTGAGG